MDEKSTARMVIMPRITNSAHGQGICQLNYEDSTTNGFSARNHGLGIHQRDEKRVIPPEITSSWTRNPPED
jgi:hypothetical protein